MPGIRIDTVDLDENTVNPLDAVLEQLEPEGTGPAMIDGLEKAVSSAESDHQVLFNLNLSRPEWPRKVPRPVVLWVPEYALRFLGQEAPDFLDWRSDTLVFPDPTDLDMRLFDSGLWIGGPNGWMSEQQRRARVRELRSRLDHQAEPTDPAIVMEYSSWLLEMGDHLYSLGELKEAEEVFQQSIALLSTHAPDDVVATAYLPLIQIQKRRGHLQEAETNAQRVVELSKRTGNSILRRLATIFLAQLHRARGMSTAEPESSTETIEELADLVVGWTNPTNLKQMADSFRVLGLVSLDKGDTESGERHLHKALEIKRQLGNLFGIAQILHELGMLYILRGDLQRAEQVLEEALQTQEAAGDTEGRARTYESLGRAYLEMGRAEEARRAWTQALHLYSEMDWLAKVQKLQARVDSLPEAESISPESQPRSGEGVEPGTSVPGTAPPPPEKP